jgi:hypothetical protein
MSFIVLLFADAGLMSALMVATITALEGTLVGETIPKVTPPAVREFTLSSGVSSVLEQEVAKTISHPQTNKRKECNGQLFIGIKFNGKIMELLRFFLKIHIFTS